MQWINKAHGELLEFPSGGDDTIVEKIVSLVPEELDGQFPSSHPPPLQIQLHDPQSPDISRYFLVFRQGCNDYARLCVEKKVQTAGGSSKRGKEAGGGASKGGGGGGSMPCAARKAATVAVARARDSSSSCAKAAAAVAAEAFNDQL